MIFYLRNFPPKYLCYRCFIDGLGLFWFSEYIYLSAICSLTLKTPTRGSAAKQARPKEGRSGHGKRDGFLRLAGADPAAGGELRSIAPSRFAHLRILGDRPNQPLNNKHCLNFHTSQSNKKSVPTLAFILSPLYPLTFPNFNLFYPTLTLSFPHFNLP